MTDVGPMTVAVAALISAAAAVLLTVLLGFYLGLSSLFVRRKDGVARRDVLEHVPWALRTFVDWVALVRILPKVATVGALVGMTLTIFAVGLLEVLP